MDVAALIQNLDAAICSVGATKELICEVGGYPIYAYRLEREDARRSVYLSSGVHGDEPAGPLAILELVRSGLLEGPCSWYLCPLLNPVGLAMGTRENGEGVDLNRDYLRFTTTEASSHARWLEGIEVDFAISLHEDWESSGFYFYEINQVEDQPQRYQRMVEAVTQVMPMEPELLIDEHQVREPGWIYHENEPDEPQHWPEAIYLAKNGCPLSFTFETPSSRDLDQRVACHKAAVRAALELCVH